MVICHASLFNWRITSASSSLFASRIHLSLLTPERNHLFGTYVELVFRKTNISFLKSLSAGKYNCELVLEDIGYRLFSIGGSTSFNRYLRLLTRITTEGGCVVICHASLCDWRITSISSSWFV